MGTEEALRPKPSGRKWDWVGLVVRNRHAMSTRVRCIPAGTEMVVVWQRNGMEVVGKPCNCCGVQVRVQGVMPSDVTVVRRAFPTPEYRRHTSDRAATRAAWPTEQEEQSDGQ